jgi:phage-related protein
VDAVRSILFYKTYFNDFYNPLTEKVRVKIDEVLYMFTIVEQVPSKWFKRIKGVKGLFEIRIEFESNIYRIFCCFDKGNIIVLFNRFQKKSQKTPPNEIAKAEKILIDYFTEQNKYNEKK